MVANLQVMTTNDSLFDIMTARKNDYEIITVYGELHLN